MDQYKIYELEKPVKTEDTNRQCDVKTHVEIIMKDGKEVARLTSKFGFFESTPPERYIPVGELSLINFDELEDF